MTTTTTTESPTMTTTDMNSQVVCNLLGRDVTRGQLEAAFNRVAPKANWKMPIDVVIDVADDFDAKLICEAVVFFTGSVPSFWALDGDAARVTAAGYYAAIGA